MNTPHPPTSPTPDALLDLDEQVRQWLNLQRGQWLAIAAATGVSHSWLSKFSRGLIANPGYVTLRRLERYRQGLSVVPPVPSPPPVPPTASAPVLVPMEASAP